jgi:hypothetical protein
MKYYILILFLFLISIFKSDAQNKFNKIYDNTLWNINLIIDFKNQIVTNGSKYYSLTLLIADSNANQINFNNDDKVDTFIRRVS